MTSVTLIYVCIVITLLTAAGIGLVLYKHKHEKFDLKAGFCCAYQPHCGSGDDQPNKQCMEDLKANCDPNTKCDPKNYESEACQELYSSLCQ